MNSYYNILFVSSMPKKHSRKVQYHKDNKKRRMRRTLTERLRRLSLREFTFKTCHEAQFDSQSQKCEFINLVRKKKCFIKRGQANIIQTLHYPINTDCVFTLYGMITIDEKALRYQTKDQSLIKALFNFYSINEVQINQKYLLVKIHKNKENYFPISYIVERFKSHGDLYFYQMAQKIEQIRCVFDQIISIPTTNIPIHSDKQIQKYIDSVLGKKAMLRIAPNCMVFTKELLELGDHTVDDIGTECLRYRSFINDIFLADDYRGQVNKFFELYQLGKRLRKGQVTQQMYLQLSRQQQIEYIIGNKNKHIQIVTNKYNLAPGIGCWQVQQFLKQEPLPYSYYGQLNKRKKKFIEQIQNGRINTLTNLTKIGKNASKENKQLVCSYKQIVTK